jgi:two-component system chemotaxis sensor kinase CheA
MTIDLRRFKQTFLEESREGLDAMEQGLLRLEQGNADADTINTVFRAAHSIKGGAGTFGFGDIATVTHLLETLLDQLRSGRREIHSDIVTVLLQSVDVLRGMLDAAQSGGASDAAGVAVLTEALQRILGEAPVPAAVAEAPDMPAAAVPAAGPWSVRFRPLPGLMKLGNDPLRIFGELATLGELRAECDASRLPAFGQLDPEALHLSWQLTLVAPASRQQIVEIFAWVEGDCELAIEQRAATPSEGTPRRRATDRIEDRAAGAVSAESSSIRVSVEKVDAMINLVGELVITQAMLKQCSTGLDPTLYEKLLSGLSQLDRNTRDLQDAVMSVRMLPMDFVFSRFPRLVRDLAGKLGKRVRLWTEGEATELDKGVIEKIVDPLNHIVRNSLDHGLESPEERAAAGKDETGTIRLSATHKGGYIVIEVADDGRGLDREKILASAERRGIAASAAMPDAEVWQLIFAPGLSTAESVTDVSGRGVGMDVVRKNILSLGGAVDVSSRAGEGMTVTIRLPLTLAILDGMSVAVSDEIFIIPLNSVVESLLPAAHDLKSIGGQGQVLRVRGEYIPLFSLREMFGVAPGRGEAAGTAVLLEAEGRKIAVWVDELVGQQQVVIKSLDTNYKRIAGVSGATIMGDGRVALIVDVGGLTRLTGLASAA